MDRNGMQRTPEVGEATDLVMDRYEFDEPGAMALLRRLARKRKVAVQVVALAVIAAAIARRADP
jgi:AmiR/NasT family two-component response regulator